MSWQPLVAASEIPIGAGRELTVGDRIIAVFHSDQGFHAIDGICPHAGGPIAEGTLRGCIVTCPWHGWQFDVSTGKHCLSDQIRQATYPVRVADGMLEVELP